MSGLFAAFVLRPFVWLIVLGLICLPARLAVERWMPDSWLKRILLLRSRDERQRNP